MGLLETLTGAFALAGAAGLAGFFFAMMFYFGFPIADFGLNV
jgi:hypothetical protein